MDAVSGAIVQKMMEFSCSPIGRHMDYWVGYKKYIKKLDDEAKILNDMRSSIQRRVEIARNNGEVLVGGVEEWLEEVERKLGAVTQILEVGQQQQLSCLSVRSRHRLGRRAERGKEELGGLKPRGDRFDSGPVAHPAPLSDIWYTHATDYQRFDSRESVFKEIMDALQDDSKYVIGIHGMPGVGKTRMADEVAKQAKEDKLFEDIAKATLSQTPHWETTQRELAECLNLQLQNQTKAGRAGELCNRLKNGKKILLILDDVWNPFNLKEIGIPFGDQTKGCKILLTSRRQEVCNQMGVEKVFWLEILGEGEAWSLLKKKVGESIDTPGMQWLAKEVCKECGGLPLAILAVGGALMNADRREWNDALSLLRNSKGNYIDGIEAEVYTPIELSYKYLKRADAQSCFLHCSLFGEDAEISIDDLLRYGVGTRFLGSINKMEEARERVCALVGILKRSSLLLQGENENFVKMHDIIRDVAISIASKDERYGFLVKNSVQGWLDDDKYECCIAISLRCNAICELPDELECPKLRTLVLAYEAGSPCLKVPDNFFKGMEKLEVLHLARLCISTLSSSLRNLVNLRMLCLTNCELASLSLFYELDKLEILSLEDCVIVDSLSLGTDSDIVEPAMVVGKFIHLRIFDFTCTQGLRVLPSGFISNLSRLEELYIYEFDKWEVEGNASLHELNYLIGLSSLEIHLEDVMLLPKGLRFESLNRFKISIGCRFDFLEYGHDSSISRALKLKGIPLKVEFNTLIERAQALSFIEINGLEKLLHDKDFPDLEYLKVEQCDDMERLFGKAEHNSQTSSFSLDKLRVLKISNCRMKYIFFGSNAKGFQQLQQLHVQNCDRMEAIIGERDTQSATETIIFSQLKDLKLEHLPKLRSVYAEMKHVSNTEFNTSTSTALSLFNEKVQAPHLEMLYIKGIDNVKGIWHRTVSTDSVSKLTKLTVQNCDKLLNIGPLKLLKNLAHNLEGLKIMNCPSLQDGFKIEASNAAGEDERVEKDEGVIANVESIVVFRRLKWLGLSSFDSLLPFSERKDSFPMLERLNVSDGSMLETFPEGSFLDKVRVLKLEECSQLVDVPGVLQRFDAVEDLILTSCSSVQVVFNLQELHATERLATLSGQVKELTLKELPKLEHIWLMKPKGGLVLFSNLTWLGIECCNNLRYLFSISIARALPQLGALNIQKCDAMEEIVMIKNEKRGEANVADEIVFPQLEVMCLLTLPELESFCGANNAFQFPSLKVVRIEGCPKLYTFTSGPTGMPKNGICFFGDDPITRVRDINEHVRQYAQRMKKL